VYVVEYIYRGVRSKDETIDTQEEIRQQYAREGKVILSIRKKWLLQPVPQEEVLAYLTAMGDLAGTGTHSTVALDSIINSFPQKSQFPPMLKRIRAAVANGTPLSKAMESYSHVFGRTVLAMVIAGEHTGKVEETFLAAADYLSQQDEISKELWKKLAYPLVTFGVGIASLILNSTVIIPKLMNTQLFKAATKNGGNDMASICMRMMKYMSIVVPSGLALVILMAVAAVIWFKKNQEEAEKLLIKIPGIREFVFFRAYYVAFSSLAKLLDVGSTLYEALEIAEKSSTFITLKRQFQAAMKAVKEGQKFTVGLTALTQVERTMLDTSQDRTREQKNFESIAKRYHRLYLDKVRSVAPKLQVAVILMVVAIFFLEFMGIVLPYTKVLNSIH
jgi:MSHA biogenesis protein MshG